MLNFGIFLIGEDYDLQIIFIEFTITDINTHWFNLTGIWTRGVM